MGHAHGERYRWPETSGTSPPVRGRRRVDIVALAQDRPDLVSFAEALFEQLQRDVGFEVAHYIRSKDHPQNVVWGLESDRLRALLAGTDRYDPEMVPLKSAALRARGVAVDTEVLGRARWECRYFRELAVPIGGRHTLVAVPRLRGQVVGMMVLGRCGRDWNGAEVAAIEALLPSMALALTSYPAAAPCGGSGSKPPAAGLPTLTRRERDVLDYLCLGYTNLEIARACGTSPNTVRNQLSSLFAKIGASTRAEAVALTCRGTPAADPSRVSERL